MTAAVNQKVSQRRGIGRRELKVTGLGLGTAPLGGLYRDLSDEEAQATIDAAWDAGIRYFDTAPHYGHTKAEHRLGHALRRYPRGEYVLSTKVGRRFVPRTHPYDGSEGWQDPLPFEAIYDYREGALKYTTSQITYNTNCCGFSFQLHSINIGTRVETVPRFAFAVANIATTLGNLKKQDRIF